MSQPEPPREQQTDFSRYFHDGVVDGVVFRQVVIANLPLSSGRIVVADPFSFRDAAAAPLRNVVKPGSYPLSVSIAKLPTWGERVAFARIRFSDEKVVRWQVADDAFPVDSGLAGFADVSAAQTLAQALAKFEREHPTGNYYDDVLSRDLPGDAKWGVHRDVVIVSSGLGDGLYASYWGFDSAGNIAQLVTDFEVLEDE